CTRSYSSASSSASRRWPRASSSTSSSAGCRTSTATAARAFSSPARSRPTPSKGSSRRFRTWSSRRSTLPAEHAGANRPERRFESRAAARAVQIRWPDGAGEVSRAATAAEPVAGAAAHPPAVRLAGIRNGFGKVVAADGIDLEIAEGEFFTMLGPSGSGKTTLLRMIAGFERPDDGTIELHGVDVTRQPPYLRDVNTVFQDYALFPHMTVLENVEYGPRG